MQKVERIKKKKRGKIKLLDRGVRWRSYRQTESKRESQRTGVGGRGGRWHCEVGGQRHKINLRKGTVKETLVE